MTWRAKRANAKGIALEEKGWHAEAHAAYQKAASLDPSWSVPWFNLGLLAKRQRRWSDSLGFNRRAVDLDSSDEGAWWNMGIAATALADWSAARSAWRGFGLDIPDGEGPLELNMGLVPIRLAPNSEVVWCSRIDPARAIIRSVPLPDSQRAFGDLLLHDGATNGSRWLRGKEVGVFDELELLQKSLHQTFAFMAHVSSPKDIETLAELADKAGMAVEDWSTVNFMCEACSRGTPHKHHLREAPEWRPDRHIGVASTDRANIDRLLTEWQQLASVTIADLELVLGPT